LAERRGAGYDHRVTRSCLLCDLPCDGDEALCSSCLADPEQRAAEGLASRSVRDSSAVARWFATARDAIRMARTYRAEGDVDDSRIAACLDEVRRCRDAIRRVRLGDRAALPGLRKAGPSETTRARRAVS
jgi:hypothetical protein